jgi:hypothetical protein
LSRRRAAVPPHLQTGIIDPAYGNNPPLFRRSSGNATITIFQGGHEFLGALTKFLTISLRPLMPVFFTTAYPMPP